MKEELMEIISCPLCQSNDLELVVNERDEREIREGELICRSCHSHILIHKGIVQALLEPHHKVIKEAKGWVELLDVPEKKYEFTDTWILALPFIRKDQTPDQESVKIWNQVGKNFLNNLEKFNWKDKKVLEIGAGRCWGVAELARRGAYAVGLDILTHKYIGLETADIWFIAEELYFERVLGDMHKLPFQPGSFDFVITTSSLHHTDTIQLALQEILRVLNENGRAFFMNEPCVLDNQPRPCMNESPEVQHGIIESRPKYNEWIALFEDAGFKVEDVWIMDDMHVILRKDFSKDYLLEMPNQKEHLARVPLLMRNGYLSDLNYINLNWDIKNEGYQITSHRNITGPFLIKGRNLVHSEVRRYIDPIISNQAQFNKSVTHILNEIVNMFEIKQTNQIPNWASLACEESCDLRNELKMVRQTIDEFRDRLKARDEEIHQLKTQLSHLTRK